MPKMHQNTFGGHPDPLGELMHSPRPASHNVGPSWPTTKVDGRQE